VTCLVSVSLWGVAGDFIGVDGALIEILDTFGCDTRDRVTPGPIDGDEGVLVAPLGGLLGVFIFKL
jgi:hypothetical protein